MDNTTDTAAPTGAVSIEDAADWMLTPELDEAEADEAPQDGTEDAETEADADALEEADDTEDEAEAEADDEDEDDAEEDADDDDDEDEQPENQTFTVKVDGEEVAVTLDELKRGYSGQAYIQKGMEEAKQFQNQLKQAAEAFSQERQQFIQFVEQAQQSGFKSPPQPPSRDLMQTDPIGYMEAKAQYDDDLQTYQQEQKQIEFYRQRETQQREMQTQQYVKQQAQQLLQAIPEFGDAEKAPKLREKIVNVARDVYGIPPEEVEAITDARVMRALYDAVQLQDIRSGKAAAKQPRQPQKTVTKPKGRAVQSAKRTAAQKAEQQAKKTQSLEDWAEVLLRS